jgi:hypothetical protein
MVDISNGLQGQTIESLKMVTRSKTKYFVGLNKVRGVACLLLPASHSQCDLVAGWVAHPGVPFQKALRLQSKDTQERFAEGLNRVIYRIIHLLSVSMLGEEPTGGARRHCHAVLARQGPGHPGAHHTHGSQGLVRHTGPAALLVCFLVVLLH